MEELSLHILDIVQNSIAADAKLVRIEICEDSTADTLTIIIADDGKGMTPELLAKADDPFVTGRACRKVGLGIPLFKLAAENTGGGFAVESVEGVGTKVTAVFCRSHIDCQPMGDIAATLQQIIAANERFDFVYTHTVGERSYTLDTRRMRGDLCGVPISDAEVVMWLGEFIREREEMLVS